MSNKNTVQNAVYQELKKGIMTLHLVPGTEMSTQEIATKLQVSRTPVREAFIQLQKEGLVEAIPQKGTKVSPINIKRVGQERFLRESLELSVIEPFLDNVNTQDYQLLRANIEKQKEYWNKRDFAGFVQLDNQFHKSLFEVAEQQLSWELISNYNGHYDRLRILTIRNEETLTGTIQQHEQIVSLAEQGKVEEVYRELKHHVRKILVEKEELIQNYPGFFVSGEDKKNSILGGSL